MANYTPYLDLKKPLGSEYYNVADQNGNMDKIDTSIQGLGNGLGIIAKGNTHAAITSGEYVYVHGHGTLAEGLYKATANIAANGTLTSSNLSALPKGVGGDVSALNSNIKERFVFYGSLRQVSDCLLVDTVSLEGSLNCTGIVTSSSINGPTDLTTGIREVIWISSTNIIVKIHGIDTNGVYREWLRNYNGTYWNSEWDEFASNSNTVSFRSAPFDGYTNQQICDALASEYGGYFSVVFTVKNPPTGAIDSGYYLAVRNRNLSTSINVTKIETWLGNPS